MKGIGQGMREFKKASALDDESVEKQSPVQDKEIKISEKT
jgi:Sec-independent protein translocase protein TatA